MSDVEKDGPPVAIDAGADHRMDERGKRRASMGRVLPWLLGACLFSFLALTVAGFLATLIDSPTFARATPTPAFQAGLEVKLVGQDGASVTVLHVGDNCETGVVLGQVPSGLDARILEEACYNRDLRTTFYRVALANESAGWVGAGDVVPTAEYTPPPPTEAPETTPTPTPWPTATSTPTQTPTPAPLPMSSPLSAGGWRVRVDRVEIADAVSSPAGDKRVEATGRFALIFLTATNQGPGSRTLHASSLYIEDAEGNRYLNNDVASAYASSADCLDFALDIRPGDSVCLVAAIDISAQGSYYVFSLHGADEYVLLDIP